MNFTHNQNKQPFLLQSNENDDDTDIESALSNSSVAITTNVNTIANIDTNCKDKENDNNSIIGIRDESSNINNDQTIAINDNIAQKDMDDDSNRDDSKNSDESDINYNIGMDCKLGDLVRLPNGKTGTIRFIGIHNNEFLIGLELKVWDCNGNDGTLNGEKIINNIKNGFGYFLRRQSIISNSNSTDDCNNNCNYNYGFRKSTIENGCFAKLHGLTRFPQLNGKTVRIVRYLPSRGRWKAKLLKKHENTKTYVACKIENLQPILNWDMKIDINTNDNDNNDKTTTTNNNRPQIEPLTVMPQIGECVRLYNGKWGVVLYVGKTDFSNNKNVIGLQLKKWYPNGHDGKIKGKRYFNCGKGKGYFTTIDFLVSNKGPTVLWSIERLLWIAFHKNTNNLKCLIQNLPKDIVFHILSFLRVFLSL